MESLEQKYAQTLEVSNLSLKQRRVLLSSLKLFSEIGFENTTSSLIAAVIWPFGAEMLTSFKIGLSGKYEKSI